MQLHNEIEIEKFSFHFKFDNEIFNDAKKEFSFFIEVLLEIIHTATKSHTVVFFWSNKEKEQLILECKKTNAINFILNEKISWGNDLLSEIAKTGIAKILTTINSSAELDLISYYNKKENIKSFLAVPIFFENESKFPIGIIAIDSQIESAFGERSIKLLQNVAKFFTSSLKSYSNKHELISNNKIANSISSLIETKDKNIILFETINNFLNFDFAIHLSFKKNWFVKTQFKKKYFENNAIFVLEDSLLENVIENKNIVLIEDISKSGKNIFTQNESIKKIGSILIIPIYFENNAISIIVLHSETSKFHKDDIKKIEPIINIFSLFVKNETAKNIIENYTSISFENEISNQKSFQLQIENEVEKTSAFNNNFAFILVKLDKRKKLEEEFGNMFSSKLENEILSIIKNHIKKYDLIGNINFMNEKLFGVALLQFENTQTQIVLEKIRSIFASKIFQVNKKHISATMSFGVSMVNEKIEFNQLIENTYKALEFAKENNISFF